MQTVRRLQGSRTVAMFFVENDQAQYQELDCRQGICRAGPASESLAWLQADDHLER